MIDSEDRLYLGGDSLERDKFSSAILGINAKDNTIVYSVDKIIEIFVLEDDMTAEEANEFFETRVCALEKPNVPWGLTNTGKSCTKVTIIELKTILLKELENVTLKYVGNVPFGLQQVAHGYGTFKDYYLQLNTSNDQGCYWISANENTTLDFDPQKPYKYDLEDTINNVKQQLRDMGNKGVLKGRITGL